MSSGWFPPPSRPRAVEGGLKARSTRGAIGQTWWSGRFIAVLEDIGLGNRLQRGRNYARRGQVISLDMGAGMVSALVQGSRPRPYRVRVGLTAFSKPDWAKLQHALADSAWYSAKLLAGEMPEDIEEVFGRFGLSLFPASSRELTLDCSCPDWEVPCKHIAAVFYLMAEAFDDDPFRILAWRGRDRDELLASLHTERASRRNGPAPGGSGEHSGQGGMPLTECLDSYFAAAAPLPATAPAATSSAAVLDQLPAVNVAAGGRPLQELLRPAYEIFRTRDG